MDIDKRDRTELKAYFVKNAVPTERNFAELIDATLNQKDDGVAKLPGEPLSIEAAGDETSQKKAINFYGSFEDANPAWTLALNPRADPGDAASSQAGFSVSDGVGNSRLFIDPSNGRVGVGTVTPGQRLTTVGKIRAAREAEQTNYIELGHGGSNAFVNTVGVGNLDFRHDGNNKMTIADSGNVGIGTTTPSAKLHVAGTLQADKYVIQNSVDGGTTKGLWMWNAGDSNWGIYMGQSGAGKSLAGGTAAAGAGFTSHAIRIRTTNSSSQGLIYENNAEQVNLSIRGSDGLAYFRGNVGIGTTSPGAKLDVAGELRASYFRAGQGHDGSVTTGTWYRIAQNTGGGKRANAEFTLRDTISSGGHSTLTFRVGIAYNDAAGMSFTLLNHNRYQKTTFTKVRILEKSTYDPQYLEVYVARSGAVSYSVYDNLQADPWEPVDWTAGAVPTGYTAREFEVDRLFVVGDHAQRLTVSRGGNVGIGTASPTAKLHVTGTSILGQEGWKNVTFQNSWTNYSTTFNKAGYFKDSMGIVHLRGLVKNGNNRTTIFTLPAGYRPVRRELFVAITNPDATGRIDVLTDGQVHVYAGDKGWISLDGMTFRAA